MVFAAIQGMDPRYIWPGIIWSALMGLIAGNYASSLIHRLPRGKSLLEKSAHCGSCGALLQVRDLFPVLSATLLRHRCRYCGTSFPPTYTFVEIILCLLFVPIFLLYGFGDIFVLLGIIASFLVILAAIEINDNVISGKAMVCAIVAGMLLRTHVDGQIFGFVLGGLLGVVTGAIIWRKSIVRDGHIYRLPRNAELMAMAGICVGVDKFPIFLLLFVISCLVVWALSRALQKPFRITIPFGLAILLPLFLA